MPTYVVLGATGSTGSAILRHLHEQNQGETIHVYARSKDRLEGMHPFITGSGQIESFIGALSDRETMLSCLKNSDVVFCTFAQNSNEPGCSIAQQTAHAIVKALSTLRNEPHFHCPIVVFLSSASLSPVLGSSTPRLVKAMLHRACYWVYADIADALKYIKQHSWIPLIAAEPPALVADKASGYKLTTSEPYNGALSYNDLGQAMIEMAESGQYVDQGVGIIATGKVNGSVLPLVRYLSTGLFLYCFPGSYSFGKGYLW